jgi:p-aminobenzoyl-glutamate transporter AbgT
MVGGLLAASLAAMVFLRSGGGPMAGLLAAPAIALVGLGVVFGSKVYLDRLVRGRGPELAALAERLAVRIASKLPALPGPGPSPSRG